ncbi:MAG: gliding motility-associated C-terminal domain-containing protein [Saprospiraceae bacterium]|nr:gliding motility-associated C-terminal domain-containing protein [Saprospiraceae bacterium]
MVERIENNHARFLIVLHLIMISFAAFAQVRYDFNGCSLRDNSGTLPDAVSSFTPECACGILADGLTFNGSDDYLTFPQSMSNLFDTDFTLDFYFRPAPSDREMDILSNKADCISIDSSLTIRYFGNSREVLVEFGSNINNFFSIKAELDPNLCWHRITFIKFNLEYRVLINNKLIRRVISRENIPLRRGAPIAIANNPCINPEAIPFTGSIDEFTIYPRALSDLEVIRSYLFPDKIVTADTTIFKGESIQIRFGNTCAVSAIWSPAAGLNDAFLLSPIASPEESTTFTVQVTSSGCTVTDSVTIYVADRDKLDCNKLLLPKAFTPNNDGLNDVYGISNTFIIESLEFFEIYDRWGARMWSATNKLDAWDGSFNGQAVNPGTYIYKIKYVCGSEDRVSVNSFLLLR